MSDRTSQRRLAFTLIAPAVVLMLAVTAGTAGPAFSLYVGLAQLPMYFAPLLLGPLVRRSRRVTPPSPPSP